MLNAALIGNIGSDPELKTTPSGQGLLRFSVASNYRSKNGAGEWVDQTEWVNVAVFGKRAETLSQHLRKGMRVFADGRLEARPWTDRSGNIRAGLELNASDVDFMSPRSEGTGNGSADADVPF